MLLSISDSPYGAAADSGIPRFGCFGTINAGRVSGPVRLLEGMAGDGPGGGRLAQQVEAGAGVGVRLRQGDDRVKQDAQAGRGWRPVT